MTLLESVFGFDFEKKNVFLTLQVITSVSRFTKIWTKYKITRKFLDCTDILYRGQMPTHPKQKKKSNIKSTICSNKFQIENFHVSYVENVFKTHRHSRQHWCVELTFNAETYWWLVPLALVGSHVAYSWQCCGTK